MKIINVGCGLTHMEGAINVDVFYYPSVDRIMNLNNIPWDFKHNSVDGIYLIHSLEHFEDFHKIILECHRILKRGGFLHIQAPHSSSVSGIGCIGHYRTFSYNTFDDYLTRPFYFYNKPLFKTVASYMNYFGFKPSSWYKESGRHVTRLMKFLIPIDHVMTFIINIFPPFYEKILHNWIGDAAEVVWRGQKV